MPIVRASNSRRVCTAATDVAVEEPQKADFGLQPGQAEAGNASKIRWWIISLINKMTTISLEPVVDPVPGVADIHVPNNICLRQVLAWAPLIWASCVGLGRACSQPESGHRDGARQQRPGNDPFHGVRGVHNWFLVGLDPDGRSRCYRAFATSARSGPTSVSIRRRGRRCSRQAQGMRARTGCVRAQSGCKMSAA
jgi:hypothetical protein